MHLGDVEQGRGAKIPAKLGGVRGLGKEVELTGNGDRVVLNHLQGPEPARLGPDPQQGLGKGAH